MPNSHTRRADGAALMTTITAEGQRRANLDQALPASELVKSNGTEGVHTAFTGEIRCPKWR